MQLTFKSAIAAAALAAVHAVSGATPLVDQSNGSATIGGFCHLSFGNNCGQSFKQTADNIAGAGFQVAPGYGAGDGTVAISIYSAYGNTLSGLVASGVSGVVNGNSGWVDVFWSPAALTAGNTYYMVIASQQTLVAAYTNTASYASGNAVFGGSASAWSGYDLAFRTYSDADAGAEVPEPMTLGLFGLGLLGLGLRRRKAA